MRVFLFYKLFLVIKIKILFFLFFKNIDIDWLTQNIEQLFDTVASLLKSKDEKVFTIFFFAFYLYYTIR